MPLYDFRCSNGHTHEGFARADDFDARPCDTCGSHALRQFPKPHVPPSGVYSYEPNIGDPEVFERRREAIKSGQRTVPKILSRHVEQRLRDEGKL